MKLCPSCDSAYFAAIDRFCKKCEGSLLIPLLNNRYDILPEINRGSMAYVYRARDRVLSRNCAIKVISALKLKDDQEKLQEFTQRLCSEANLVSKIQQENIVTIYDFGVTKQDMYYLVMEYLEGETLADLLKREKFLPLNRVLPIIKQCADGLTEAHNHNIIHRDLKPNNIFIIKKGDQEKVKILDFGIAKVYIDNEQIGLTKTGFIVGSPAYMSPEQIKSLNLDARSDLYSLALITYTMLTGSPPFQIYEKDKKDQEALAQALAKEQLRTDPLPPSQINPNANILPAIDRVVLKALSKDRDLRPATVQDFFLELIEAAQSDLPTNYNHYQSGLNYFTTCNYLEAAEQFSLALTANADVYYYRGLAYFNQGKYKEALADFVQTTQLDPKEAYYYHLGLTYYNLNDFTQAIENLTTALKFNASYSYYYFMRGKAYFSRGNYSGAIDDFIQAVKIDSQNAVSCYFEIGLAYYNNKNYQEAVNSFTKVLEFNQHDYNAYYQRGMAYLRHGNRQQAIQDFQSSLKLKNDPNIREILHQLDGNF